MKKLPENLTALVPKLKRAMEASIRYGTPNPRIEELYKQFKKAGFLSEYKRIHAEVKEDCKPFGAV